MEEILTELQLLERFTALNEEPGLANDIEFGDWVKWEDVEKIIQKIKNLQQ